MAATFAMLGCALEVGARALSPARANGAIERGDAAVLLFERDPELGHVPRANAAQTIWNPEWQSTVSTNSFGMRGPQPGRLPSTGRRVLAIGDSFTLGMQVEDDDTFVRQLQAQLSEVAPTHVWNAGVDNYGTFQAIERAERALDRGIRFDALVLTLFMGNDLTDNTRERGARGGAGRSEAQPPRPPPSVGLVSTAWAQLLFERWRSGSNPTHKQQVARDLEVWCSDDALAQVLPHTRSALEALDSLARKHQVPLVVALAPPLWVTRPAIGHEIADWVGLEGFDPTRVPDALKAVAPPSTTVIDLTAALADGERETAMTYRYDAHWTPAGHAVVADTLAPTLSKLLAPRQQRPDLRAGRLVQTGARE